MITFNIILLLIVGVSIGLMDSIEFHYEESIPNKLGFNKMYWNTFYSWKNKYIDVENGILKRLSKFHLYYYDAWHTLKEYGVLTPISILIGVNLWINSDYDIIYVIIFPICCRILIGLGFKLTYR